MREGARGDSSHLADFRADLGRLRSPLDTNPEARRRSHASLPELPFGSETCERPSNVRRWLGSPHRNDVRKMWRRELVDSRKT
jgi:hypothetical protein